jgi:hypothetical protein
MERVGRTSGFGASFIGVSIAASVVGASRD